MFDWRWDFTFEILPRLLWATLNTLLAAGIGYGIALVLGLVLALAQRTRYRPLTFIVRELVEFVRSTPLVLQIFFVFYVGPQFGIRLSPWVSGMIAIGPVSAPAQSASRRVRMWRVANRIAGTRNTCSAP